MLKLKVPVCSFKWDVFHHLCKFADVHSGSITWRSTEALRWIASFLCSYSQTWHLCNLLRLLNICTFICLEPRAKGKYLKAEMTTACRAAKMCFSSNLCNGVGFFPPLCLFCLRMLQLLFTEWVQVSWNLNTTATRTSAEAANLLELFMCRESGNGKVLRYWKVIQRTLQGSNIRLEIGIQRESFLCADLLRLKQNDYWDEK